MYRYFFTIILMLLAVSPVFGIEGRYGTSCGLWYFGGDGPAVLNTPSLSSLVLEPLGEKDGVFAVLARVITIAPESLGNRINYNWYPASGYQYEVMLRFAKDNGTDPIYVTVPAEIVLWESGSFYPSPIITLTGYFKFNYNYPAFPGDPPGGGDGGGGGGGDGGGDGDPDPPGGGGDPPGTGDPDPPGGPDPDPDPDPPNQCTCGACCVCRCTCGQWSGVSCSALCEHNCPSKHPHTDWQDCECHHEDKEDDEECCEHHQPIQDATERTADAVESIDEKLNGIKGALDAIDAKLTVTDPGSLTLAPLGGYSPPGVPNLPGQSSINSALGGGADLQGPGEVEEKPLSYFERNGTFELPDFKYDVLFGELKDKFAAKFGIDSVVEQLENEEGESVDLNFTVDFMLPEPFNSRVGPFEVNVQDYIDSVADTGISNIIRLLMLAVITLYWFINVLGVVFLT